MKRFARLAAAPALVLLGACATPDAALDQANHTSALMAGMEKELGGFRRAQAAAELSLQESLHVQRQALAANRLQYGLATRARQSAGDMQTQVLIDRLVADAEALGEDETAAAQSVETNDDAVAKLLAPLPATNTAITRAQAKMAALGTELSRGTRVGELRGFVQEVRKSVDANRKKIDEAQAAAAAPQ